MSRTIGSVLASYDVILADDLLAEVEVPILTGPQRQGDVGIWPATLTAAEVKSLTSVTEQGVTVVRGDATGNTHRLFAHQGVVEWAFAPFSSDPAAVALGVLRVAEGAVADLIHDDEHGVNCFGPGTYRLTGKREQAEIVRRVAD